MSKRQSKKVATKRKLKPKFGLRWNRFIGIERLPENFDPRQYCDVYGTWSDVNDDFFLTLNFLRERIKNQLTALEQASSLDEYEAIFNRLEYGGDAE